MSDSPILCTIDLEAPGKQVGRLQVPRSSNSSGWSNQYVPIVTVANGDGPTAIVLGGVHGDEPEGQVAALNLARELQPEQVSGRVIVIPCVSIDASRAYTRLWPSGANMNRSFPGSPTGPADEQLAHFLSTRLFPRSDIVVDMHSGGRTGLCLPWSEMHWVDDVEQRRQMVDGMLHWNTDWCCVYIDIAGTGLLVGEAERQGKIVVSTELGGGGHVTAEIHRLALSGLQNVLRRFRRDRGRGTDACLARPARAGAADGDGARQLPSCSRVRPLRDGRRPRPAGRGGGAVGRIHFLERPDREPELILSKTAGIVCVDPGDRHHGAGRQRGRDRARGGSLGARLKVKRFKVAATQVDVRHTDVEHNLEIHLQLIAEAAEAGCELIVFPETSATGNNGSVEVTRFAEPHDGRIFETIRKQAKACGIVVSYGFCERFRGTHYNTSALVGPDGLIGLQRKVHASYDEFFRFRQAYEWGVYDLGFCTVGTAICHDSDFFESWRILALKGAEVILLPHANRTMPAGGGVLTFDGRENLLSDDRDPGRPGGAARGAAPTRPGSTTSSPATTACTPCSPTWSGTTVTARTSAAPMSSLPTARCSRGRSSRRRTPGSAVELDPAPLEHARENPWFALKKRRPEAYDELTTRL